MDVHEMNKPEIKVKLDRSEKLVLEYEQKPIEEGKIIFIGSSGFTRWSTRWGNIPLEECILGKDGSKVAINHGIGGSTMEEILYYYPRLVKAWKPRAIVVSTFINDRSAGYQPKELIDLLARFFAYARVDMPGVKLYVTTVRPNAKHIDERDLTWERYAYDVNAELRAYCNMHDDVTMIPIHEEQLYYAKPEDVGDYAKVRKDIFIEDMVHFTPYGYELFTEVFLRYLDDIL